jgi:hypothetical protein
VWSISEVEQPMPSASVVFFVPQQGANSWKSV